MHAWWFAEQHIHFHIDGIVSKQRIHNDQLLRLGCRTQYRKRTALSLTNLPEPVQ